MIITRHALSIFIASHVYAAILIDSVEELI